MNETHGTRKQGADKIVLLGLFIAALLTARLIVASKSALVLSEPVELAHTGLSVSMPMGNGWRSEKQWEYQQNAFILRSEFAPGPGRPTAWAYCQYLLAAETAAPEVRFEQKAFEIDGVIVRIDQTLTDTLAVDWAYIEKPGTPLSMFLGTARLPNNRQLDIQVHAIAGDADLAERAFKRIVKSLSFKDDELLEAPPWKT